MTFERIRRWAEREPVYLDNLDRPRMDSVISPVHPVQPARPVQRILEHHAITGYAQCDFAFGGHWCMLEPEHGVAHKCACGADGVEIR